MQDVASSLKQAFDICNVGFKKCLALVALIMVRYVTHRKEEYIVVKAFR